MRIDDLAMEFVFTPGGGGADDQLTADATLAAGAFEEVEDPPATFFGISDSAVGSVLVTVKVFNADNQEGTVQGTVEGQTLVQINNIVLEANPQSDNQPKRLQVDVSRGCYVQVFRVNPSGDPITIPPVIR